MLASVYMPTQTHTHTHRQSSQEKRAHTYRERIHFPVNTHRLFKAPAAPRSCHMPTVCLALKQEANQRGNPLFCIIYSFLPFIFKAFIKIQVIVKVWRMCTGSLLLFLNELPKHISFSLSLFLSTLRGVEVSSQHQSDLFGHIS